MKRYVAGLDGGGTKTAVNVADETGKLVHAFTSGAINYNGQDELSIRQSFQEIFETIATACEGLDACAQIVIGAAGVSNPSVIARLEANVRACGYHGELLITGDQETALCGAHESEFGIILIAGTGSICYGKNEAGFTHRSGGYGYLIDDEGSGYSIGRDLLAALVRSQDGRLPETVITGMVYEQLQLSSVQQIIGFVYDKQTNKKDIAALAPILSAACELGDKAALGIVNKSAQALCEIAVPVVEKLSLQRGSLAMAGSVLMKNTYVQSLFAAQLNEIYPQLTCITAKNDAANGAVWMALNRLGR
ncbi:N-acetylmuramic acid/N-acetylglucosamine kinase [Paenibacillus marchantiophytorum]|uniref:N-acetylmuramic acid/N-acetylglucosamine kinase n=1 Tax=Paenibacillus marchantiophytorum TaxID=1619310 RepID=A0ABQ2BSU9_9BACL|nr:BadF/BadG/BcrA/BcrD ATPase family protein [Paenibacillus marchantiophytorum]GGI46781.1 N-acetylmuramic acid/N-acetylglucosamine kinase [Paenibacillus marchantiophytorum]